jgi:hypothetical protein
MIFSIILTFSGANLTLSLVKGFHKDGFKSTSEVENKPQGFGYGDTKV